MCCLICLQSSIFINMRTRLFKKKKKCGTPIENNWKNILASRKMFWWTHGLRNSCTQFRQLNKARILLEMQLTWHCWFKTCALICFSKHCPSVVYGNKQAITALFSAAAISTAHGYLIRAFTETGTDSLMEGGCVSKRGCPVSLDLCSLPVSFTDKWKNLYLLNFVDDGSDVCEWDSICVCVWSSKAY